MPRIEFGWVLPLGPKKENRATFTHDVTRALEMIKGSYGSVWVVDHLQFDDNDVMEGWTTLTHFCALHPELKWGHAVLSQSFRNPALLAKMSATLQELSEGRLILGLGAGWKEDEYRAYNYPFPSAGQRIEELDDTLHIVKAMWRDERATFEGKHYSVKEAWCEPKPDPIPTIMIGAMKPKMIRLAARHADWWNVSWTPIDDYRPEVEECERACQDIGRDPSTLRRTWFGGCACAPTEAGVEKLLGRAVTDNEKGMVGTPSQLIERMAPFVELGVDYFMLGSSGFPDLTTLEMLLGEVLPALNA